MAAQGKRSISPYTLALLAVAIGYVVLVTVLLNDSPSEEKLGRLDSNEAAALVKTRAINSAYQYGYRTTGELITSCAADPPIYWNCVTTGFKRDGQRCTVLTRIDVGNGRRPNVSPTGRSCTTQLPATATE